MFCWKAIQHRCVCVAATVLPKTLAALMPEATASRSFRLKPPVPNRNSADKFISVIYHTLQQLTINGIDKELLEAHLNYLEFKLREADFGAYPKGLIYGISVMDSWLYDGDPLAGLRYTETLQQLREGIKTRYYEQLIENYLLDNTHKVIVTLNPEQGKEEREQEVLAEKMAVLKASHGY